MSPKELNYIEDALGHEQFLKTQCQEAAQNLQDVSGRGNAGCKDNCILRNSEVHQQEETQGNVGTQDQTNQEAGLG